MYAKVRKSTDKTPNRPYKLKILMLFSLRTDTKYVWRKQMVAKKLSIE